MPDLAHAEFFYEHQNDDGTRRGNATDASRSCPLPKMRANILSVGANQGIVSFKFVETIWIYYCTVTVCGRY